MTTNTARVVAAITDACVNELVESLTVADICKRTGLSRASVGRALQAEFDALGWSRVAPVDGSIIVRGRNYGEIISERKVQAWTVTKRYVIALYRLTR